MPLVELGVGVVVAEVPLAIAQPVLERVEPLVETVTPLAAASSARRAERRGSMRLEQQREITRSTSQPAASRFFSAHSGSSRLGSSSGNQRRCCRARLRLPRRTCDPLTCGAVSFSHGEATGGGYEDITGRPGATVASPAAVYPPIPPFRRQKTRPNALLAPSTCRRRLVEAAGKTRGSLPALSSPASKQGVLHPSER